MSALEGLLDDKLPDEEETQVMIEKTQQIIGDYYDHLLGGINDVKKYEDKEKGFDDSFDSRTPGD